MSTSADRGAEIAASIMTIIQTAKANDLCPQTSIADLLSHLPDHKINRLDETGNSPKRSLIRQGGIELALTSKQTAG